MTMFKEDSAYYMRFISMYIDLGSEVILKVFVHHTPGKNAESFLLSNTSELQQLKKNHTLNKQESDLVLSSTPNPREFDISLLITLSSKLFSEAELPPPKKGWFVPPKNSDTSIAADLLRLRTIRNLIIGHRAKAQLPEWRFKDEWEKVQDIFLRIYRVIAPDEESQLKQRIEHYRLRTLDPLIEDKYDSKLREWHQQISEIQQQVEDAFKTVKDIDKYLKSKSDRYERYIKLLVKGGRCVILALVERTLKEHNKNLRDILKDKEDNVREIIDNSDHLHILYPSDQGNSSDPIDMSTWDITLLVSLLLYVLDSKFLDDDDKDQIVKIETARKNYAEAAVVSLNSDAFAAYSSTLHASILYLSQHLDSLKRKECKEIVAEWTNISKGSDANQTYFDELKSQTMKIKSIQEIYEEKIKKTKHILQEMITHGIDFKNEHVLELKMITHGCDEEKKQLGEKVLTDVWRKAKERSGDSTDFDALKREVLQILAEIRKPNGVKGVDVKQECILLGITCTSPCTFLGLLNYFESMEFNLSMNIISSELGYLFNTIFTVQGNVTLESLEEINTDGEHDNIKDEGISIPITITSPEAVMQLRSLFESKAMMNSTNTIADRLSRYLKDTVTVKISHDMGHIQSLFDDLETEHSSSANVNDDTDHIQVNETDRSSKADAKQRLSTSGLKALESSEENKIYEQELVMQQKEDDTKNMANKGKAELLKEGLEPICDDLVEEQYFAILDRVKQKQNLTEVSCQLCTEDKIQPDHVQTNTGQCPLGQMHCNCQHPRENIKCPNKVCGVIYDEIIKLHAFTPPAPNWSNTDAKQWCTKPWAIAKCFIHSPGYKEKNTAAEFDFIGLVQVLLNNKVFRQHLNRAITGTDVFSSIRNYRNFIFYPHNMELDDTKVHSYIDYMIELLENDEEIKHRQESKDAVKKLRELKQEHLDYSTKDETKIRRAAMAAINEKETELEQAITDAGNKVKTKSDEENKHYIERKGIAIELEQAGQKKRKEIEMTGAKIRHDLVMKQAELKWTRQQIRQDLVTKEAELEQRGQKIRQILLTKKADFEQPTAERIKKPKESTLQLESHKHWIERPTTKSAETRKYAVTGNERKYNTKTMAHKVQLENMKYRNWVRAGLGIKYVKEGLEPFCDHLVKQQHIAILDKVKRKHNLRTVSCGLCDVSKLQPDHLQTKTRQCPLGQMHCNCQHPRGKFACRNAVCGAIYDEIIQLHASTPPAPNWRNTDAKQWCTEPWAIAECFINAPGCEQKNTAAEFDCTGLLHVLLNNTYFHQHINCVITGTDVFSRVRKNRNIFFHSDNMELEDTEFYSYIDDMIDLLEDEKEIKHRQESKDAVKKLQELKQEHFMISTKDETEVRRAARTAVNEKEKELKQTITDADSKIRTTVDKEKHEFEQTGQKIRQNLIKKVAKLEQTAAEQIEQKELKLQLESHKNLIEWSMTSSAETRKDVEANKKRKEDFQKKLVKLYERDVRKVTPMPRLYRNKRNVNDMYVPSLMTEDIKNKETGRWEEVKISMDKIFRNNEKPAKCIFVIGEAGSGKSTFCKMLVHFWCIAHSQQEDSLDKSNMVTEMERFDFLFYVPLRYYSDCGCIEKMLKKSFDDPALGDILQNGSNKCLIVLDGLDEWNLDRKHISQFQTPGLPGREVDADFTTITTSRQWKFDALSLSESEVGKNIKLNGIELFEIRNLTVKTVETLNDIHKLNKNAEICINDLRHRQVSDISHIPLMLQQLVCLWYNDKLQGDSQCAIYGSMLDLFLDWKSLETSESQNPLYNIETSRRNTHVKQYLSYLAYETLFDKNKETTLTFSSSKLIELSIPDDVIKDCLASGVLKEERNVSLSENIQSTISFFHKSVQEYLAAVYIASQFKEMHSPKDVHALIDVGKKCVDKYFGSYKTVRDIFEHSNVLIMLCGLEPRLLTNVSEYIYNVSLVDEKVVEERNNSLEDIIRHTGYSNMINRIQSFIFKCVANVLSSNQCESNHSHVYIADLNVSDSTDLLRFVHNCILKSVRSIEIKRYTCVTRNIDVFHNAMKYLTKCDQLQVIKVMDNDQSGEMSDNIVTSLLATNINTLETVFLKDINEIIISGLVSILPNMRQLTSIQVEKCNRVSHSVFLSLSKFLNQTTRLQYISIGIYCEDYDKHKIDLSNHKQLRHASFMHSSFRVVSCNTDNLETCKLSITSVYRMNKVYNILCKAGKLKLLYLVGVKVPWSYSETQCRNITDNLIRLLSSLHSLSTLFLCHLTFSDNIILRPCDMKNLKEINFVQVTMSMKTWCKFVDCLPALPSVVEVGTISLNITDNLFGYRMMDEKQRADALQYVREKTTLFRVPNDISDFQFTTKKT